MKDKEETSAELLSFSKSLGDYLKVLSEKIVQKTSDDFKNGHVMDLVVAKWDKSLMEAMTLFLSDKTAENFRKLLRIAHMISLNSAFLGVADERDNSLYVSIKCYEYVGNKMFDLITDEEMPEICKELGISIEEGK